MRNLLFFFTLCIITFDVAAQEVPQIETTITQELQYSDQDIKDFKKFDDLQYKVFKEKYQLNEADKKFINSFTKKYYNNLAQYGEELIDAEIIEYPWNLLGPGCSWYCGAVYSTKVSSYLKTIGNNIYTEESLDDDTRTAWVEGVPGYGIGEYIEFTFPYYGPRATSCTLVNGYYKDDITWKKNSRVKTFNVYENDTLIAIVHLKDTKNIQTFDFPHPIPNRKESEDRGPILNKDETFNKPVKLKFVIKDVYKGDKYDDTAISSIIFDGLDVHCLAKGTKVSMADGTEKNIENIRIGDSIISYNIDKEIFESKIITKTYHVTHNHLVQIDTDDTSIITTKDHPFWTNEGWKSLDPTKTKMYNRYQEVEKYKIGDNLLLHNSNHKAPSKIIAIKIIEENTDTYTLELDSDGTFIANKLIVGQE